MDTKLGVIYRGVLNHQLACKGVQRHNQLFLHMELLSHDNKPRSMHTLCDQLTVESEVHVIFLFCPMYEHFCGELTVC